MTMTIVERNLRKQLKKALTRPKLKTWLKSKSSGAIVGEAQVADSCPIFRFLEQQNVPVRSVTEGFIRLNTAVDVGYISGFPTITIKDIPQWTSKFINGVDHSAKYAISAKLALEILDKI